MSLIDRDYMHRDDARAHPRQDPRQTRPPAEAPSDTARPAAARVPAHRSRPAARGPTTWSIAALCLLLVWAATRLLAETARLEADAEAAADLRTHAPAPVPLAEWAPPAAGPSTQADSPAAREPAPPRVQRPQPSTWLIHTANGPVTKCQGGGRTSYSQDGRCPPGMEPVEMTRPALSQADALPVAPPPAAPPASAPAKAGTTAPKGKAAHGHRAPGPGSSDSYAAEARRKRTRHCESLARQLRLVDERAAQPMSAAAQDRLREQRRRLQQQQTDEHCP